MTVNRIVANLSCSSVADAAPFYKDVFGLEPVMDHGWIATLADPLHPDVQISLLTSDATAPVSADVSLQVDDVDAAYAAAKAAGAEIVHPLTDEAWGVRRFFVRGPDGHVLNVLSHQ
jgi:catechol 2,3-dioxygenase-like lactoylglutathione lyase family enzyme